MLFTCKLLLYLWLCITCPWSAKCEFNTLSYYRLIVLHCNYLSSCRVQLPVLKIYNASLTFVNHLLIANGLQTKIANYILLHVCAWYTTYLLSKKNKKMKIFLLRDKAILLHILNLRLSHFRRYVCIHTCSMPSQQYGLSHWSLLQFLKHMY